MLDILWRRVPFLSCFLSEGGRRELRPSQQLGRNAIFPAVWFNFEIYISWSEHHHFHQLLEFSPFQWALGTTPFRSDGGNFVISIRKQELRPFIIWWEERPFHQLVESAHSSWWELRILGFVWTHFSIHHQTSSALTALSHRHGEYKPPYTIRTKQHRAPLITELKNTSSHRTCELQSTNRFAQRKTIEHKPSHIPRALLYRSDDDGLVALKLLLLKSIKFLLCRFE